MSFQDFQAGHHLAILDIGMESILNLHVTPMPPTKVGLNQTYNLLNRHGLMIFKMATMGAILDIRTEWF